MSSASEWKQSSKIYSKSFISSHIFAAFDRDHNGTIDFHEFLLAVATSAPYDLDSHLEHVFEM